MIPFSTSPASPRARTGRASSPISARRRGAGVLPAEGPRDRRRSCRRRSSPRPTVLRLPVAEKEAVSILKTPHYRGWAHDGLESLDETSGLKDRKESFNIGFDLPEDDPRVIAGEPFRGVNQWPDLPGVRDTMLAYYDAALDLGVRLARAIALDLGLPEDHFDCAFHDPLAALRVLHYPPATGADGEIGAGAHSDYGVVTLLMTDGEPGLQVKPRGGDWMDVPHVPGAYVVNIGDCLMRWTNDIYVSTPHRVLPPKRVGGRSPCSWRRIPT
jgi:isopenicillin N synthase-like dioxygenase